MKAILRNYHQSPRKVGLVAGLIRGKKVSEAVRALTFTTKRATLPILNLLKSAAANAKNAGVESPENLYVTEIQVNKANVMRRIMPRARGSAAPILKKWSHVSIILSDTKTLGSQTMISKAKKAASKVEGITSASKSKKTKNSNKKD
jgi:large subunit ribosomal protein L22